MRTGSAKYDKTPDTTPRSSPLGSATITRLRAEVSRLNREKVEANKDISRLEEISAKLRVKVTGLEKAQSAQQEDLLIRRRNREREADQAAKLREKLQEQEETILKQEEEMKHLKFRRDMHSVHVEVSPDTSSQSVEAITPCTTCEVNAAAIQAMESKIHRYSKSAEEAERLGDQVARLTEEKERYRQEVKKLRSQSDPRKLNAIQASTADVKSSGRVRQLESQLERSEAQWARRIESLRVKHEQIVRDYEDTIKQLTSVESRSLKQEPPSKLSPTPRQLRSSRDTSDELRRANAVLKTRVKDLEDRVESVKQYYQLRSQRTPTPKSDRCIQRFMESNFPLYQVDDDSASSPPVPLYEVILTDWIELLRSCTLARDRESIAQDLTSCDYAGTSLVDRKTFARAIGPAVDSHVVEALTGIYAYGDEQVDYKTFLSDIATRSGVYASDVEAQNRILRGHVEELMRELSERIESVESGPLIATLDSANRQIAEKENELKLYKAEMNRFLATTRQVRRLGVQD